MFRETCQVEAGSVTVKWSVLVDRKVSLVSTEVHFASTVACIIFFKVANKSALHHRLLQDNIDRCAAHVWRWLTLSSHRTALV